MHARDYCYWKWTRGGPSLTNTPVVPSRCSERKSSCRSSRRLHLSGGPRWLHLRSGPARHRLLCQIEQSASKRRFEPAISATFHVWPCARVSCSRWRLVCVMRFDSGHCESFDGPIPQLADIALHLDSRRQRALQACAIVIHMLRLSQLFHPNFASYLLIVNNRKQPGP